MERAIISKEFLSKLAGPEPLKDKLAGRELYKGDFQHDWQEFVGSRQDDLDEKLNTQNASSEFFKVDRHLHTLIERAAAGDEDFISEVHAAVYAQQHMVTYASYNKGFFEGIKFALFAGQI